MSVNYPSSLDTDASLYLAVNNTTTTVASGYTSPASTISLTDASNFPSTGGIIYVDNERGVYTGKSGNDLTGVTGLGNNHSAGVVVDLIYDAAHHNNLKDAIIALQTKLGVTGDTTPGRVITRLSKLDSGILNVSTTPTTLTVAQGGLVLYDTTSEELTSNLPTASGNGGLWYWLKNSAGSNNVIIDGSGSETIDGNLTLTIVPGDAYAIRSDGTNWQIIGMYRGTDAGLTALVQDTTPQLGGDLDTNGFEILFDTDKGIRDSNDLAQLLFTITASAVNYFNMTNAATGNGVTLEAKGTDTDIDVNLLPKGAGSVNLQDKKLQRPVLLDYGETVNALGDLGGGTDDIDLTAGNVVTATVSTSTQTFTFSNPPASGTMGGFMLILTNGGSQTVNWPASVDWEGGTAPTLTAAGVDVLYFVTVDAGTTWHGFTGSLDSQ